jgi:hypothetical protein
MFLHNIVQAVESKLGVCASIDLMHRRDLLKTLCWIDCHSPTLDFPTIVSYSSSAWLDAVLIEVLLRNRDRFNICWPIVEAHFRATLLEPKQSLSRNSEIQLNGFLKLSGRLLARESCLHLLIEFLGKLCGVSQVLVGPGSPCCSKTANMNPIVVALANQVLNIRGFVLYYI